MDDLVGDARRLGEAHRVVLLDAQLRDDVSEAERDVLLLAVDESAGRARRWLTSRGLPTQTLPPEVAHGADGPTPVPASVRRTVRRALAPAWGAVGVGTLTAASTWVQEPGRARGDAAVVLLVLGGAVVAVAMLAAAHLDRAWTARLGSSGGSLTGRARTVGRHVEALLAAAVGPPARRLVTAGLPTPPLATLLRLRAWSHRQVLRVHAAALVVTVVLFTGLMRALGLLDR